MGNLVQDIRYGIRVLRRSPGFTSVAVFALALGISANTAIFSVVSAVLLRSLPYKDPDRITVIWADNPSLALGLHELPPSPTDVMAWRNQNHVFERIAAFRHTAFNLSGRGEPVRIGAARVTADLFAVLGIDPMHGRAFRAEEDQPGKNRVVVVSYGLWQRRFGGDPDLVGRSITLDNESFTVVGIMPPGFQFPWAEFPARFPDRADLWTPLALGPDLGPDGWSYQYRTKLVAIGRVKSGVSLRQAQAEMSAIAEGIARDYPSTNAGWTVRLTPLREQSVGKIRPLLVVVLGAAAFVLLIACTNVANLLLARAISRRTEIAVRSSLGAGRFRVVRQLLAENLLLAVSGGALGLLLAHWGVSLLIAASPANIPRLNEARVDRWVLAFTAAVSLLTGVLSGLVPALYASKANVSESLKGSPSRHAFARGDHLRGLLVISEVAVAAMLLVGAGLMIRSFWRLQATDPGFNPESVLAMDVVLPEPKYQSRERKVGFFQETLAKLEALPGIRSAAASDIVPLTGSLGIWFRIDGRPPVRPGQEPLTDRRAITPGYFRTLGIPLLQGRLFDQADARERPPVVIINETMARRHFSSEEPIGKRLQLVSAGGPMSGLLSIVGVVRDVKIDSLEDTARPQVYVPMKQSGWASLTILARTDSDPLKMVAAVRSEIRAVDPDQPIANVRTMERIVSDSMAQRRFNMLLLGLFAAAALVLTVVGLYGVVSHWVGQRTHEIGIRMALGAQPGAVLTMVVRQGMALVGFGLLTGIVAALVLTRILGSLLYQVSATDPVTFASVSLLLGTVGLTATCFPARRATQVDPMIALRYE